MTKEALRLALEALESTGENNGYHGVTQYFDEAMVDQAITAIKAALEAKDEPVETDWERIARVQNAKLMAVCDEAGGFEKLCEIMDKYEAITPTQRTWVGLTDEHKEGLICMTDPNPEPHHLRELIDVVEFQLKERNT